MERATSDRGVRLLHARSMGLVPVVPPSETEDSSCGLPGCGLFGHRSGSRTTERRFIGESREHWPSHRTVVSSYRKQLRDYNLSHVMEKTAGEDNLIKRNGLDRLERYRVTLEDVNGPWVKIPMNSTNANEGKEGAGCYYVRPVYEQEIAYKLIDEPLAAENETIASLSPRKRQKYLRKRQKELMYQHKQEKKILSALDHPNIIKPVIINEAGKSGKGDSWEAQKRVVIAVRPFSVTERRELAETITEHDDVEEDHQIDFDFEVVESFDEGPAGIPLPPAETTLLNEISTGLLSEREKYDVVLAMVDAVAYTHQRGCVHLDIKPRNMVMVDGRWVLTGWTLSHHYKDMPGGSLAFIPVYDKQGYFLFGSNHYQAPQIYVRRCFCPTDTAIEREIQAMKTGNGQAPFCETDARAADAYSLGIVLFELLTEENPTPSSVQLEYATPHCIERIFQSNVNRCLRNHRESLGEYYRIVSALLQSKCSDRITVATAKAMLEKVSPPQ